MSGVSGKSVVVTGSSSGIGEATALLFARTGWNVTLCGRDTDRLQVAAEKCRQAAGEAGHSNRFISVPGDMRDASVRHKVLEDTLKAFGQLDCLVVNHGVVLGETLDELTEEEFDKTIDINLKSFVFLIKDAVQHLEKTRGSIVCVSSIFSFLSGRLILPYYMSKAALDQMVRCMALELGPKGIRINAVNPTLIRTRIFSDEAFLDAYLKHFEACTPLAGQSSTVQNPAQAIAFLASDQASYISGQCLAVDGAVSCKGNPANWTN